MYRDGITARKCGKRLRNAILLLNHLHQIHCCQYFIFIPIPNFGAAKVTTFSQSKQFSFEKYFFAGYFRKKTKKMKHLFVFTKKYLIFAL